MFDYFVGQIKSKNPAAAVLEVNGIAFKLMIPLSTYEVLPASGQVKLFSHLAISGGMGATEIGLYGFSTGDERQLFQLLMMVTRVGPSMALRIVSGASVQQTCRAIMSDDVKFLARIKGVGEKTAQRIIMELKETVSTRLPMGQDTFAPSTDQSAAADAILAMVSLGYQRITAEKNVKDAIKLLGPKSSTEEIVRKALSQI
ncbi:MAG: Holliday junction branch migration protein RuvA [Planctomycetota bacterium]